MLLSSDATAAAVEICSAGDFYKPAHGSIFGAIVGLFERGEPVDAVTVTDELRRSSLLDVVADPALLVSLQANTPSIANAVHYATSSRSIHCSGGWSGWPARSPRSATRYPRT